MWGRILAGRDFRHNTILTRSIPLPTVFPHNPVQTAHHVVHPQPKSSHTHTEREPTHQSQGQRRCRGKRKYQNRAEGLINHCASPVQCKCVRGSNQRVAGIKSYLLCHRARHLTPHKNRPLLQNLYMYSTSQKFGHTY